MKNFLFNAFIALTILGLYQACTPPASAQTATLTLTWTDNSDNEDGFILQYKTPGSDVWLDTEIDIGPDVVTVSHDVPLVSGGTYWYRIAAYTNWYGNYKISGWSNEAQWQALADPGMPNAPTQASVVLSNTTLKP